MVTDGVCVRVTNIGYVISHIHDTQRPATMRSRKDCRKLGWDVFESLSVCVCVCVCVCEFKSEIFFKFFL